MDTALWQCLLEFFHRCFRNFRAHHADHDKLLELGQLIEARIGDFGPFQDDGIELRQGGQFPSARIGNFRIAQIESFELFHRG